MRSTDGLFSRLAELDYARFVAGNWRFLGFGVLLTFFASAGQTYFISVFGGEIRNEFGLTHGEFGGIYALAGIGSAICLLYFGRLIDRVNLRLYAVIVCGAVIGAVFLISVVASTALLGVAIFALRFCGQGLMSHTAMTSMGRYFEQRRGSAVAISTMGGTIGIAAFPIIGVTLIAAVGWRQGWIALGLIYLVVLIPLILWSLKGFADRHAGYLEDRRKTAEFAGPSRRDRGVKDVLQDLRFYFILPASMAPSFIMTGFIFHQVYMVESKGWSMTAFAGGYAGLAITSFGSSLVIGAIVDRIGATRILPWFLIPITCSLVLIALFDHPVVGFLYLLLMGMNMGGSITLFGSLWPEIYGVSNLGAVRSFSSFIMVISSALGPLVMGGLIDLEFSIEAIALMGVAYMIAASVLAAVPKFESRTARAAAE